MTQEFGEQDLSRDKFLGGKLCLWQPKKGYRAGVDPVLLAASVPAKSGQAILDLGCGVGAVGLCLAARVPGLHVTGVEIDTGYAELARQNGAEMGVSHNVCCCDLRTLPEALKSQSYDHVVANPPYYDRQTGTASPDDRRETALGESAPLADWVKTAFKRLKPKGYFHMVIKADRLDDALASMARKFGSMEILPIAPRPGRTAELVILRGRKEGRAKLRLCAPLILHQGNAHQGDQEQYTPEIAHVLRDGHGLEF